MNLIDIWHSKTKIAIHCDNADKARNLISLVDEMSDNECLTDKQRYQISHVSWVPYDGGRCYTNVGTHSSRNFYEKTGCQIISYDDITALYDDSIPEDVTRQFNELMSS